MQTHRRTHSHTHCIDADVPSHLHLLAEINDDVSVLQPPYHFIAQRIIKWDPSRMLILH